MAAKKLIYPAADRNKEPILAILKKFVRRDIADQKMLEIASGTGQHVAYFAPNFPEVTFYPSELDPNLLQVISGNTSEMTNIRKPSLIDIKIDYKNWPDVNFKEKSFDYIYCANMIHVSPWESSVGLFKNAGSLLKEDGILFTYGAYAFDGKLEPESNVKFNESIKSQNPEWGIRDVEDLKKLAEINNIRLAEIFHMPANNKTIVWRKYIDSK